MKISFPTRYSGYQYWIEGTPPQKISDDGEYWYYVIRDGEGGAALRSNDSFTRVLEANKAAREAIDRLTAVLTKPKPQIAQMHEEFGSEVEPKPRRRRRAS